MEWIPPPEGIVICHADQLCIVTNEEGIHG
jgi:hypothetical protein